MAIKSDRWIQEMAQERGMIEPFVADQVRGGAISYGLSSYGYDMRVADEWKVFTNVFNTLVDPKHFDPRSFVDIKADSIDIPPNSFALARSVEYFRIPRRVLCVVLGKSTYARCFSGDTRVALVDGSAPTLEELARRWEAGLPQWGYGVDRAGRVVVSLLEAPRYIGRDSMLELTLDSGATIRCTPDHRFLLHDGTMIQADDLRPGSALQTLQRARSHGDEVVYQPATGGWNSTRRLADAWLRRFQLDEVVGAGRLLVRRPEVGERQPGMAEERSALRARMSARASRGQGRARAGWGRTVAAIRELPGTHDVFCLTVPETGNFALAAGVFVSNCGLIVNVTPLEPEWQGHVTIEISNTTPLPARVYANEGVAQVLFLESDEDCLRSYGDKAGKYQNQTGVVPPRM